MNVLLAELPSIGVILAISAGIFVVLIFGLGVLFSKFYRKVGPEEALVLTGKGGLRAGTGRNDNSANGFGRTTRVNGRKAARTDGISPPGPRPPERGHPEGAQASSGFLASGLRPVLRRPYSVVCSP